MVCVNKGHGFDGSELYPGVCLGGESRPRGGVVAGRAAAGCGGSSSHSASMLSPVLASCHTAAATRLIAAATSHTPSQPTRALRKPVHGGTAIPAKLETQL